MSDESDGINEALAAQLRVGVTVAGRIGEVLARQREQQLRNAQAESEQEARELTGRLEAQRSAAGAALAPLHRDDWWETAQPRDIAQAWETASTWREQDAEAARAQERIRAQLRDRYGIDTADLGANEADVRDALQRRERELADATGQRVDADRDRAEAQRLISDADRADRPLDADHDRERADELYDSAERREDLAASLEGVVDEETVEARVVADTHQGRPAHEAVANAPKRAPRAKRPARQPGRAAERIRGR